MSFTRVSQGFARPPSPSLLTGGPCCLHSLRNTQQWLPILFCRLIPGHSPAPLRHRVSSGRITDKPLASCFSVPATAAGTVSAPMLILLYGFHGITVCWSRLGPGAFWVSPPFTIEASRAVTQAVRGRGWGEERGRLGGVLLPGDGLIRSRGTSRCLTSVPRAGCLSS